MTSPTCARCSSFSLPPSEFEVVTADGGRAAVELLGTRRFDVAITDLKMPGMNGVETVAALRQLDPDMEVIVATGYSSLETALACMKHGAYDYIRKPYDITELRHLILRAVEKRRLRSLVPLYEVSCALLSMRTRAEVVAHLGDLALDLIPHQAFRLLLPEPGHAQLSICASNDGLALPGSALRELAQRAIESQEPVCVLQTSRDWPFSPVDRLGSALAYSLQVGSAPAGSLILLRGSGPARLLGLRAAAGQPLRRPAGAGAGDGAAQRGAGVSGEGSRGHARGAGEGREAGLGGQARRGPQPRAGQPAVLHQGEPSVAVGVLAQRPLAVDGGPRGGRRAPGAQGCPRWRSWRGGCSPRREPTPRTASRTRRRRRWMPSMGSAAWSELLNELRALSDSGPPAPTERVDVVRLLSTWAGDDALPRPVRLEVAGPVHARASRDELEASLVRILHFVCEATPARQPGERACWGPRRATMRATPSSSWRIRCWRCPRRGRRRSSIRASRPTRAEAETTCG